MALDREHLLAKLGTKAFLSAQKRFMKRSAVNAERLGERLASFLWKLDKKHRKRTFRNLEVAFPELSDGARQTLALNTFKHFGRVMGDFLRSPVRTHQEVLDSIDEIVGFEHYEEASARGKGILVITAHFGNWERFAQYLAALGKKMSVVQRDANDSDLTAKVTQIREKAGIEVLSRGNSARAILKKLKENEIVGILPDQNAGDAFVKFFDKPCGTVLGPAVLHIRTGAALLPCYCVRTGPAKYRVEIMPLVDPENVEKDATAIMAELNLVLESIVRRYPDQYLWLHDRWKEARHRGMV